MRLLLSAITLLAVAGCQRTAATTSDLPPAASATSSTTQHHQPVEALEVWDHIGFPCDNPLIVKDLPDGKSPNHMPDYNGVRDVLKNVKSDQPRKFVHERLQGLFTGMFSLQNTMKGIALSQTHSLDEVNETILNALRKGFDKKMELTLRDLQDGTQDTDGGDAISAVCPGM